VSEQLQKINSILTSFNSTFKLEIHESNGDEVNGFTIKETIGDGRDFINEIVDLFEKVITNSTEDYELVYNEEKGLVLAKKVPSVNYEI
jgi:hypothetical protein